LPPDRVAYIESLKPGDMMKIGVEKQKNVLGATDYLAHLRLVELLAASDEEGIQQLVAAKRCVVIDGATPARMIKRGKDYIECRVTSGELKGKALFIHWTWVR
jgi:hypothetical protein